MSMSMPFWFSFSFFVAGSFAQVPNLSSFDAADDSDVEEDPAPFDDDAEEQEAQEAARLQSHLQELEAELRTLQSLRQSMSSKDTDDEDDDESNVDSPTVYNESKMRDDDDDDDDAEVDFAANTVNLKYVAAQGLTPEVVSAADFAERQAKLRQERDEARREHLRQALLQTEEDYDDDDDDDDEVDVEVEEISADEAESFLRGQSAASMRWVFVTLLLWLWR